jgi:hypothetical protein
MKFDPMVKQYFRNIGDEIDNGANHDSMRFIEILAPSVSQPLLAYFAVYYLRMLREHNPDKFVEVCKQMLTDLKESGFWAEYIEESNNEDTSRSTDSPEQIRAQGLSKTPHGRDREQGL